MTKSRIICKHNNQIYKKKKHRNRKYKYGFTLNVYSFVVCFLQSKYFSLDPQNSVCFSSFIFSLFLHSNTFHSGFWTHHMNMTFWVCYYCFYLIWLHITRANREKKTLKTSQTGSSLTFWYSVFESSECELNTQRQTW